MVLLKWWRYLHGQLDGEKGIKDVEVKGELLREDRSKLTACILIRIRVHVCVSARFPVSL